MKTLRPYGGQQLSLRDKLYGDIATTHRTSAFSEGQALWRPCGPTEDISFFRGTSSMETLRPYVGQQLSLGDKLYGNLVALRTTAAFSGGQALWRPCGPTDDISFL